MSVDSEVEKYWVYLPNLGEDFTRELRFEHERNSYLSLDEAFLLGIKRVKVPVRCRLFGGRHVPIGRVSIGESTRVGTRRQSGGAERLGKACVIWLQHPLNLDKGTADRAERAAVASDV